MQNINSAMQDGLMKIQQIDSFLESTYPHISTPTKNLYRVKLNKYMSGNIRSDKKRLELLLRQDVLAVKAYRKLFNQFLYYCQNRETEGCVKQQKGETVMTEEKKTDALVPVPLKEDNSLPINTQLRKIPKYEKLVKVFVKDREKGMTKKEIVNVFYPIINNKRTYLSYFYSYLKELDLWDGKDTFYITTAARNKTKDTNIETKNGDSMEATKTVGLDDVIESVKSLGLDALSSESILQILNNEKQKREMKRQKDILLKETENYISALKVGGLNEDLIKNIHQSIITNFPL